ncbi:hypothetical protein PAPYR_4644 [Paratrimastix pyriformis]|uniref:Thioredoxin domain-containing protein n=1 Tax=Paratrimastix pyriformis TaxID=342808 RepID=A0ABQ8UM47_9EUKA|nr:hypothetical protein PAPYR_4644 [Paratrimastix pyriformis]
MRKASHERFHIMLGLSPRRVPTPPRVGAYQVAFGQSVHTLGTLTWVPARVLTQGWSLHVPSRGGSPPRTVGQLAAVRFQHEALAPLIFPWVLLDAPGVESTIPPTTSRTPQALPWTHVATDALYRWYQDRHWLIACWRASPGERRPIAPSRPPERIPGEVTLPPTQEIAQLFVLTSPFALWEACGPLGAPKRLPVPDDLDPLHGLHSWDILLTLCSLTAPAFRELYRNLDHNGLRAFRRPIAEELASSPRGLELHTPAGELSPLSCPRLTFTLPTEDGSACFGAGSEQSNITLVRVALFSENGVFRYQTHQLVQFRTPEPGDLPSGPDFGHHDQCVGVAEVNEGGSGPEAITIKMRLFRRCDDPPQDGGPWQVTKIGCPFEIVRAWLIVNSLIPRRPDPTLLFHSLFFLSILCFSFAAPAAPDPVTHSGTLAQIQASTTEKVVFFVDHSEKSEAALKIAEKLLNKFVKEGITDWEIWKCDCVINAEECRTANFVSFPYVFENTAASGIEQFQGPIKFGAIWKDIKFRRTAVTNPEDVLAFTSEDGLYAHLDQTRRSVLVKFYEKWCSHCNAFKPTFQKAATQFRGQVDFAEVECATAKDFCAHNDIKSYPTLILFTGEDKIAYDQPSRDIHSIEEFLHSADPTLRSKASTAGSSAPQQPATPTSPQAPAPVRSAGTPTSSSAPQQPEAVPASPQAPSSTIVPPSETPAATSVTPDVQRQEPERMKVISEEPAAPRPNSAIAKLTQLVLQQQEQIDELKRRLSRLEVELAQTRDDGL